MKNKLRSAVLLIAVLSLTLTVAVSAYDLPQKYSSDDYTTPYVDPGVPSENTDQETIYTYFNGQKVPLTVNAVLNGGTIYLPAEEIFRRTGFSVGSKGGFTIRNGAVEASFGKSGKKLTVNGKEITLKYPVKKIKGIIMCPAELVAEIMNAKVWYDELSKTFVISTGKYKNDGILRSLNGKFWMDGQPYYEISFNKFDLFRQVASYFNRNGEWPIEEETLPAAIEAIEQLHSLGFKTIRVFDDCPQRAAYIRSEKQRDIFYEIMDTVFDLCDKNDIKMVCSLTLFTNDFIASGEDYFDMFCDPSSQSRQNLYKFLDDYVTRYKTRKSVLMWEITNEGNLEADIGWATSSAHPSLYQMGRFYSDVAERIRQNDPEHLVTGGDSVLRPAQWHLYLGVKEGRVGCDWTRDTMEDRMRAYVTLYRNIDVISMHCYSTGLTGAEYQKSDTDTTMVPETFEMYMQECRRLGKPFYNGETAVNAEVEYTDELHAQNLEYLQSIIDAGVQISHWWTFRSTAKTHKIKGYSWVISDGPLLDAIVDANRRLKEKYVVNGLDVSETTAAWGESDTVVAEYLNNIDESTLPKGCGSSITGSTALTALVAVAAAMVILLKKEKSR